MNKIKNLLEQLSATGNLRRIPRHDPAENTIDLSSNDYLGIAQNVKLIETFRESLRPGDFMPSSSASRLLASRQDDYTRLEDTLAAAYGREALLFNSGYHANTGIIAALADKRTLFLADKLVHASIIDGLNLAAAKGATYLRYRHNDFEHLNRLMDTRGKDYDRVVIVAETVYSMDGDTTDLGRLVHARSMHPNAMIYVDEAHSVGVLGPQGLGLAKGHLHYDKIDIIVGTFGKALASIGAYAVTSPLIRDYLVNTARPLVFSTSLPPVTARWTLVALRHAMQADDSRRRLHLLAERLAQTLGNNNPSHIQPLIIGDAHRAVEASRRLLENGYRVLPIRTPTVPPGTERLRFSLSATLNPHDLDGLGAAIAMLNAQCSMHNS